MPGDILELRGFHAFANGQPEHPRLGPCEHEDVPITWPERTRARADFGPVKVPAGQYALAGDCRDNSYDFRDRGPTPRAQIVKRVSWIWWSSRRDRIGQRVE
jgi:signal peptidase I